MCLLSVDMWRMGPIMSWFASGFVMSSPKCWREKGWRNCPQIANLDAAERPINSKGCRRSNNWTPGISLCRPAWTDTSICRLGMNRHIDVPVGISMCRSAYRCAGRHIRWISYLGLLINWDFMSSPTGNGVKERACPLSRPPLEARVDFLRELSRNFGWMILNERRLKDGDKARATNAMQCQRHYSEVLSL
jgi:hypothetical protein